MQDQLRETVHRLNRIIRLYEFSIIHSSPYRIGRVRNLFESVLLDAKSKYEIREFSSKNYIQLFDSHQKLEVVIFKKRKAITSGDYELAASLRDDEKSILRSLLLSIGVNKTDQFFATNERIYKIT